MGATANTIWEVPAYLPFLQPPLTEETVAATECEIGHKLPDAYLDLLRKQNGGYIRFRLPEMIHSVIAGIGPYFPSLSRSELEDCQEYVSFPLQGLVPFDGDGHWYLCLDYRRDPANPGVSHVDIELDSEGEIAGSFADYLALLRIDLGDNDEFVLATANDVSSVKAALASKLDCRFDSTDTWSHGYATHRARLGSKDNPEWAWLSPNSVPRGFARPDEPRYAELKDLMPGNALRFPEIPADSYLLGTTAGVRSQVLQACIQLGFGVRPLREYFNGI